MSRESPEVVTELSVVCDLRRYPWTGRAVAIVHWGWSVSDRRVFRVRRLRWRSWHQPDAKILAVLVTDAPGQYPSASSFGFTPHFGQSEHLSATPEELGRWEAAGAAYLDAVAAAAAEFQPVRQGWRRWQPMKRLPVVGGWVSSTIEHAEQRYLLRVREATEIYQPSLQEIEQRLAETEAQRRAEARRQWEHQQASQRAAEARFDAEMAAWQRARETGVQNARRNVQARDEAVATIVAAIEHAATTLEAAEQPGAQVFGGSSGSTPAVRGWQVRFRWPDSPVAVPSLRPPRPVCYCHSPSGWFYGVFGESRYLPEVVLAAATVNRFGREARDLPAYRLARKRTHGFTDYDRHLWRWELESPADFAEELVHDRISWLCQCAAKPPPFQLTEHAHGDQYVPYVRQLAQVAAEGFGKVVTDQLDAVSRAQRNLRARDDAKRQIVKAVEQAWQALELAGRPGIGPVRPDPHYSQQLRGWRVDLDWSSLTAHRPVVTPPPQVRSRLGNWVLLDEPHPRTPYVALTEDGVVAVPQRVTFHAWDLLSAADFAERIMFDWFTWWPHQGELQYFRIAEHADPTEYLPYVHGITEVIAEGFSTITPSNGLRPG